PPPRELSKRSRRALDPCDRRALRERFHPGGEDRQDLPRGDVASDANARPRPVEPRPSAMGASARLRPRLLEPVSEELPDDLVLDGLDEVAVEARRGGFLAVLLLAPSGHGGDDEALPVGTRRELPRDLVAVHPGHSDVAK